VEGGLPDLGAALGGVGHQWNLTDQSVMTLKCHENETPLFAPNYEERLND
jgi:hypothetical protein